MDPYGNLTTRTGSLPIITANLNNWNVDNNGRLYRVQALCYQTSQGIRLHPIIVHNPWPGQQNVNSMGRNEYAWANFAPKINAHWYVRVY